MCCVHLPDRTLSGGDETLLEGRCWLRLRHDSGSAGSSAACILVHLAQQLMRAAQQALDVEKNAPDPFRAQKDLMEESELPAVPSGLVLARSENADWLVLSFDKVSSHPDDPLCRSRPWKVWITFVAALLVMLVRSFSLSLTLCRLVGSGMSFHRARLLPVAPQEPGHGYTTHSEET